MQKCKPYKTRFQPTVAVERYSLARLRNAARIWFHCLIHLHGQWTLYFEDGTVLYACAKCCENPAGATVPQRSERD